MNGKLGKMGIFLILLLVLLSSALGVTAYETFMTKEGYTDSTTEETKEENQNMETPDQVNDYNNVNSNSSTYNYVSSPTSLPQEGTPNTPTNYSSTTPTSLDIDVGSSYSSQDQSQQAQQQQTQQGQQQQGQQQQGQTQGQSSDYGEGDGMYALKSSMVPPVCPKCPDAASCPRPKPCPACPPCARCPEPAFECKKVPSYQGGPYPGLPRPILNDFSQFGM